MKRLMMAGVIASALCGGASAPIAAPYKVASFDLSALPPYVPSKDRITGVVRISGTPLEYIVGRWAAAFREAKHGQIRLSAYLINTSQAFAGLMTGKATVGLMGHRQWLTARMAFKKQFGYDPVEIRFATGSYDDPEGSTPGLMFIVNKNNPLAHLTMDQLDGIFGAQRTGGWVGTTWSTAVARGPEKNIRTWGQLGVKGDLADKPIHLYGSDVTLSNWADLMEREVFKGGTKWNPDLIEKPRADISTKAQGRTRDEQIIDGVTGDPSAIGFVFQRVIDKAKADVKVLPIGRADAGPFVVPNAQSFFDGSYPMHNGPYIYLNKPPGQPLAPREREFVRFVLSRDGQQILADSRIFIPLNAEQAAVELKKIQ